MKIYFGGVNGVGKSTILKEVGKLLNIEYVHATSFLMDHFGFGGDYEKLRALSQKERDIGLTACVETLCGQKGSFLMDGHYLGMVRGEVKKVTDRWIGRFDALGLIDAPFSEIWERIGRDSSKRDRALFPNDVPEDKMKESLVDYQKKTQEEFLRLAGDYKKPAIEIINHHGRQERAIAQLCEAVRSIQSST